MPSTRERVKERVKVKTKPKRAIHTRKGRDLQAFLFFSFWLAVLVQCVALYKRHYTYYTYSRVLVVPILLVRIFSTQAYKKLDIYVYICILSSLFADLLTIFGNYSMAYIGLGLFTASYLSLGCFFQQLKDNHNKSHWVFILAVLPLGILSTLWIGAPELHKPVFYCQIGLHAMVLAYIIYGGVRNYKKIALGSSNQFMVTVAAIVATSIVYGLDVLYLNRKYPIVDALVGLGNGFYMFMLTRSAIRNAVNDLV